MRILAIDPGNELGAFCLVENAGHRSGKVRIEEIGDLRARMFERIRATLIDRFGPGEDKAVGRKATPGPFFGLKGDEWSALAIALTAHEPANG